MAFFSDLVPEKKNPPNDFDIACSKKLKTSLVKKGRSLRRTRLSSWANEFRILRKYETEKTIQSHLDWYCLHIGKPYIPDIQCGKSFKEKFDKLKNAKKRSNHVDIDDDTLTLVKKLKAYHWPGGFDVELDVVVQKSLNQYSEWYPLVKELKNKKIKNKWNARYVEFFCSKLPSKAIYFVELYMLEVCKMLQAWKKNLPSTLHTFTFHPDNKVFASMGREWSREQYSSVEMWDVFMSLVD